MTDPVTVLDHVEALLRRASSFDRNDRVAPAAVIWTDEARDWEPLVIRLRQRTPIFTLGEYDGVHGGPAVWLRCIVDRTLGEVPADQVPIVYIPGYGRGDLRAVESCPADLQAIAELQYRGTLFGSRAGRDWTATGLFRNVEEGLGIDVARDDATVKAFLAALPVLADEAVELLRRNAPLKASELDALLNPDPDKALLRWLNDPKGFEASADPATWAAFVRRCVDDFAFDPAQVGAIGAAERLGERAGRWGSVWERYAEVPTIYPAVAEKLRASRPMTITVSHPGSWPQDNENGEHDLREMLGALRDKAASDVRQKVLELESTHAERRDWVWARLGQAPLAGALLHLGELARKTAEPIGGANLTELAATYASEGWQTDSSVLLGLAAADALPDRRAVEGVVTALYRPWADASARAFQDVVARDGTTDFGAVLTPVDTGECVLFTDGLRFDIARRLEEEFARRGAATAMRTRLTALPSLTATAKPAASPVADALAGGSGFGTVVAESGQNVTAEVLRKLMAKQGLCVLQGGDLGDPNAPGWTECGNIDEIGHTHEDRFPFALDAQVRDIVERALALLEFGWQKIRIVTDHGWLYVPGGLEKAHLPEHLTETRKGRAARLTADAPAIDHPVVSWRWDPDVRIALAPGITCYVEGRVYEHGGLSTQECVTPELSVSLPAPVTAVAIAEVQWVGMRARISVAGGSSALKADVRSKAAAATSSKLSAAVSLDAEGRASMLIDDPDAEGDAAFVVVLASDGSVIAQRSTVVGGE